MEQRLIEQRLYKAILLIFATNFILIAGGHGIGFVWMLLMRPLNAPVITFPAILGTVGILTATRWRSPQRALAASSLLMLLCILAAIGMSEAKFLTLVTAIPAVSLTVLQLKNKGDSSVSYSQTEEVQGSSASSVQNDGEQPV